MADTDIMKMKVADLKRELRLRGLSTTGNKNELQERLQAALIDGELSLEDTGIGISEDILDEDGLSDEDEKAVLGESNDQSDDLISLTKKDNKAVIPQTTTKKNEIQPKKVVLKRKNPIPKPTESTSINTVDKSLTLTSNFISPEKVAKIENNGVISSNETNKSDQKKVIKLSELSMKERLEMRAKKFGGALSTNITKNSKISTETDDQQIQTLKKRAERFGCVISSKIAEIEKQEKLLKRQQRFGTADVNATKSTISNITNTYEEKAKLRLERFKPTVAK